MKLPIQSTIALLVVELLASCSCSRTIDEQGEPELLQHRVDDCQRFCEVRSGECGPDSDEPWTVEECVEECATIDGALSWHWGPQADTREDACIAEWKAHSDCLLAATCDEQQIYSRPTPGDPPLEERVCWEERHARDLCAVPGKD